MNKQFIQWLEKQNYQSYYNDIGKKCGMMIHRKLFPAIVWKWNEITIFKK
jgi:hypothetical protein